MSYSISHTAKKKDFQKELEEKLKQYQDGGVNEYSQKQLDIAKQVAQQQLELAKNEDDVISFIASGHASDGYANGKIEFGIRPSM